MERKATRLDLFSFVQKGVYGVMALLIIGVPIGASYLADAFLPDGPNPIIRTILVFGCMFVSIPLGLVFVLALSEPIEDFFTFLRRSLRMKPLTQIEQEIRESQGEQEERAKDWFLSRSEAEQRYAIWRRLETIERTKQEIEKLKLWIFFLGVLVVFLILAR